MNVTKNRVTGALVAVLILSMIVVIGVPEPSYAAVKKPAKVTSFRVTSTDFNYVTLKWGKQSKAKKYEVYRATKRNGKYKKIATTKKSSFKCTKLTTGKTYWFKVRGVNGYRKGSFSKKIKGTPKLKKPKFGASSEFGGAKLTAGKVKGATGYIFYRDGKIIKTQKSRVYIDKNIAGMVAHTYKVAAYRKVGGKKVLSKVSRQLAAAKITVEIKLVDCALPGTLSPANDFSLSGKVTSNVEIKGIEVGIVNRNDMKWMYGQKYQNYKLNTEEFDLSKADSSVNFSGLGGGTYSYRIYVHMGDGIVYTALNHTFSVKASKGAMAAVVWAKRIANDNSFAYGTGKRSHRGGCYFCGTNTGPTLKKKEKKGEAHTITDKNGRKHTYDKTYCCNPFVFAAFAHGAKNSAMLKACKKGKCGGMLPGDWTRYGCFKNVGKTTKVAFKSLKAGDVIISDTSKGGPYNHVWMYCGNNQYVDAGYEGWGAGTIAVKGSASNYYKKYRKGGCYVMRYTGN